MVCADGRVFEGTFANGVCHGVALLVAPPVCSKGGIDGVIDE